jgi:drug/metabolite transporter (DMT)-like permease
LDYPHPGCGRLSTSANFEFEEERAEFPREPEPRHSEAAAVGFAICGFTFWVLTDTVVKIVGRSALPAYEIIAFLGAFMCGFLALYAKVRHELKVLWPTQPKRQIARSCLDLANNLCVVVALRHVSLTLFYILVFLSPMCITVLAAIFLHEKIGVRKALAIVAGFAGVVIAVNPFGASRQGDWIGFAACMVCVSCFSVNMVWSRVLTRTETPQSLAFFSGVVMTVAGTAGMMVHAVPLNWTALGGLAAMGALCSAGTICFYVAVKHTAASTVSQYHYTQLVTGALVTFLVWRELPTVWMVLGGALIVGAGLYIAMLAKQAA